MPGPPTWSTTPATPCGAELADPGADVLAPVVDRHDTQVAQPLLLRGSSRADDRQAGLQRQLHEDRADAAGRAQHDDRRPARGVDQAQDPQRRQAVDDHGLGRSGRDAVGDSDEVAGVEHDALGPPARLGQGGDPLTDPQHPGGAAELLDEAHQVVAGHERERGLLVVLPPPHRLLGERHPGDLDAYAGLGGRERPELHEPRLDDTSSCSAGSGT